MKKIFVAGHNGMVGSAICRKLKDQPNTEIITISRDMLDLCDQLAVYNFIKTEKPDEIILNHFDIVKNHTDLNGDIKHKNSKELIKTFSLIITHNYGTSVYELCNFLKFLNNLKLSVYHIMVMNRCA